MTRAERALAFGFGAAAEFSATLNFREEVRQMCRKDTCGRYGRCWQCPPACGSLDALSRRAAAFPHGLLVQTFGALSDPFDLPAALALEREHCLRFSRFVAQLKERVFAMGAGGCRLCERCTYPDSPCLFPDLAMPSMEACGLDVGEVCRAARLPYSRGEGTVTFTSLILFEGRGE